MSLRGYIHTSNFQSKLMDTTKKWILMGIGKIELILKQGRGSLCTAYNVTKNAPDSSNCNFAPS